MTWFPSDFYRSHAQSQRKSQHLKPGENILESTLYFPSFADLSEENDVYNNYWEMGPNGAYVHACTWCFIGEITFDETSQIPFLRNRVQVKDRSGQDNINIYFYPREGVFDFTTLKKGHTVCVMLAERHHFLDMTIGLRIENLDIIKVIPCGLDTLFALSKDFYEKSSSRCWACGKPETKCDDMKDGQKVAKVTKGASGGDNEDGLKKCGSCKVARYCGKVCQQKDWKERHRKLCKVVIPEFVKLTKIDYSKYEEYALFHPLTDRRIW